MYNTQRYFPGSLFNLISDAANIRIGNDDDTYTLEQFYAFYPQFKDQVPEVVAQTFLNLALCNISKARWNCSWEVAIALFIAHFLTLYTQTCGTTENPITDLSAGLTKGIATSKSVDGVSVSYDLSAVLSDTTSWGAYQLTQYGVQLLTLARLLGKGGVYVH